MAMRNNAAGGHGSRVVVNKPVRTGSGSRSARPAGVSQIGYAVGDKATHQKGSTGYKGEKLHSPDRNFNPTKFGNELAAKAVCGPGGSREVMPAGGQGQHGAPASGLPRARSVEPGWPIWGRK